MKIIKTMVGVFFLVLALPITSYPLPNNDEETLMFVIMALIFLFLYITGILLIINGTKDKTHW